MNHCLLEAIVKLPPTIRYTQDSTTPIAEMEVNFPGLREEDPQGTIKVVGWGNLAQELERNIQVGQKLILEGRLRMNTVPRQDGTKEKKAEFTLSKFHAIAKEVNNKVTSANELNKNNHQSSNLQSSQENENQVSWDSSPLVPETDQIPF